MGEILYLKELVFKKIFIFFQNAPDPYTKSLLSHIPVFGNANNSVILTLQSRQVKLTNSLLLYKLLLVSFNKYVRHEVKI